MVPDLAPQSPVPRALDTASVFREHGAYAWRVLRRLGVAESDVEDVCQEVFVVVHRRLADFEGRSAIRTWVYGICVRTAADYRKRASRKHEIVTDAVPEGQATDDPHGDLTRRETVRLLDAILSQLDDDKRAVFVLYAEIEQLTMNEVAEVLSCSAPDGVLPIARAARAFVTSAARRPQGLGKGCAMSRQSSDPERLLISSSPGDGPARTLVEAGRDELPSDRQLASVAACFLDRCWDLVRREGRDERGGGVAASKVSGGFLFGKRLLARSVPWSLVGAGGPSLQHGDASVLRPGLPNADSDGRWLARASVRAGTHRAGLCSALDEGRATDAGR